MSRIRISTGYFGSGKTKVSINYAIKLAKQEEKVVIVDLNIVNPYFYARNLKNYLKKLILHIDIQSVEKI